MPNNQGCGTHTNKKSTQSGEQHQESTLDKNNVML